MISSFGDKTDMLRLDFRLRPKNLSNPWHLPRSTVLARAYAGVFRSARKFYGRAHASPDVDLSPHAAIWLHELRRKGIIRIENKFATIAEYLETAYFHELENRRSNPFVIEASGAKYTKTLWTEINARISFKDPKLTPLFFDRDLNGVLRNYYGRQPYFRNQPLLQRIDATDQTAATMTNGQYHVDHLHQVSIMFLVSRVTDDSLHMRYAMGSNQKLRLEGYYDEHDVEQRYPIMKLTGAPGTLYMFDTAGVHRAMYIPGTSRKILHLNFTTGHDLDNRKHDSIKDWPELTSLPEYSRRLLDKIAIV
jgi:hypothetical protein